MVDVQIVRRTTELAAPPISFEHSIPKRLVLSKGESQPRRFLTKLAQDLPRAPDAFYRLGEPIRGSAVLGKSYFPNCISNAAPARKSAQIISRQ
jgi:hypothetical protein